MNFKTFWKKRSFKAWFCSFIPVLALTLAVVLVLTCNTFLYQTINAVLGGERRVLKSGDPSKYQYYTTEYKGKDDVLAAANALNERIVEEGAVLLKNENNALPVAAGAKATVFGKNSVNAVYGGSGSNAGAGGDDGKCTLYDSLESAGIEYNDAMKAFYDSDKRSGDGRPASPDMNSTITGLTGFATGETPADRYDDTVRASWKDYNDLAIVFISRIGGEGFDLPRSMFWDGKGYQNWNGDSLIPGARNKDDHYLQLDKNETDMISVAAQNFDKVVVVLNCPTSMELGFLDDPDHYAYSDKIKACLWIGTPGNSGMAALGRILTGKVNPSGRTADIYARDFKKDPTWNNFGNNLEEGGNQYVDENGEKRSAYFVHYSEGIYIGYRYYETRALTESNNGNGGWYKDNVVFPFGYGLSYTDFTWSVERTSHSESFDGDDTITVDVKVVNVGDVAGKDVVQLYYSAPYYSDSGIEKSHVVLGAFAKTKLLQPGESDTVALELSARDMASYDYADGNGNGFKGYELEHGNYTLYVARDSHDRSAPVTLSLGADVKYETDGKTETPVKNLFDDVSSRVTEYMSRDDFEGTFPQEPSAELRTLKASDIQKLNYTLKDKASDPWYSTDMPDQSASELTRDQTKIKLYDLIGKDYEHELWDELLDQLTVSQMRSLIEIGNYHTEAIVGIDKPKTTDPDGPMGYSLFMGDDAVYKTCYYAGESLMGSTFNVELAEEFGKMIGDESLIGDRKGDKRTYSGWYAPACNLHRSQFGGRNFEYYSEDPVLSAKMAVGVIQGAMSKGVYTYLKHFVMNDQETNRDTNGIAVWANEQTMRELYFLPFEKAVKDGGTTAMMSSFNRIGFTWAGGNHTLLTKLLRDEWGFKGMVITDYNLQQYMNVDQMIRAGGDVNLSQSKSLKNYDTATSVTAIRKAAKNILYTVANSNAMNGMGEGNVWAYAAPVWFIAMWVVFAVLAAGFVAWGAAVIAKIAVEYNTGVKSGVIVPPAKKQRVKDPDFKMSKLAKIFIAATGGAAVALAVTAIALLATPAEQSGVPQDYRPYVGGITLTFDNMPVTGGVVTVERGGDTHRITALVDTYGMESGGVVYESSDENIAAVGADGTIDARAVGECSVTVTVVNDKSVYGALLVRVTDGELDGTAHVVTVVGGSANLAQATAGTTVILTPETRTGMRFVGWEFDCEVEQSGNLFRMPSAPVTVTAKYEKIGYKLTLDGATFADGESEKTLLYEDGFPQDMRYTLDDGELFFGWRDKVNGKRVTDLTMPARDMTIQPMILAKGDALVMAENGFDYGSGTGGNATDTDIDGVAAKRIEIAAGQSLVRIKNGGVTGGGDNDVYVGITLRNPNEFDITLEYQVEYYGVVWGTGKVTVKAGETATYAIVVNGLDATATPYHRIVLEAATEQTAMLDFCGFIYETEGENNENA